MNYSPELKDALLRRMLPPNNESITKISREEGIAEQTLRNWRDKARKEGYAAPGTDAVADDWSTQDKFLVVVETASMNETELAGDFLLYAFGVRTAGLTYNKFCERGIRVFDLDRGF